MARLSVKDVERADHVARTLRGYAEVNHGGFDRRVSQKLLNVTQVDAGFEEMSGKAMPHRVRRGVLFDSGTSHGLL